MCSRAIGTRFTTSTSSTTTAAISSRTILSILWGIAGICWRGFRGWRSFFAHRLCNGLVRCCLEDWNWNRCRFFANRLLYFFTRYLGNTRICLSRYLFDRTLARCFRPNSHCTKSSMRLLKTLLCCKKIPIRFFLRAVRAGLLSRRFREPR